MHTELTVGFDTRSARLRRTTGWERYTRGLWHAIEAHTSLRVRDLGGSAQSKTRRLVSDWGTVPATARGLDLAIFPSFPPTRVVRCPTIYVVHDLTWWRYPETASAGGRLYYRRLAEHAIRRAYRLVTDSATVRAEVLERFELPEDRVAVCPLGIDDIAPIEVDAPQRERPFLLVVATQEPRKNLPALIAAYEAGGLSRLVDLVFVGRPGWGPSLRRVQGCRFTGDITDSELGVLYRRAHALVSPSLYEGFGLPLLEAMSADLAVYCSDIAVYREVTGGHAAGYFDPTSQESMVKALRSAARNCGPTPEAGEWAKGFSWRRAALTMQGIVHERVPSG